MKKLSYLHPIKNLVVSLAICLCLIIQAPSAFAGAEKAKDYIQSVGDKVIAIAGSDKLNDAAKEQKLNALFIETVDINWMGKFVIGKYWREATPQQQQKYLKLYKDFLVNSYVSKFRQYTNQKMVINKFSEESEGEYIVETAINDTDGKSYNVSYKTRKEGDSKLKIYDIVAEGVSLITTQRSDFGSILSRDGMDGLIKKLEQKS